jgi:L-fuculose-phosphate aldolase
MTDEDGRPLAQERQTVVDTLPALARLTPGRTGNLSVRRGERFAITPTGVPYDDITVADVPVLTLDGEQVAGDAAPSSETPMHRGIYEGIAVGAIAHTHSPFATTLAVLSEEIPPVHYMLALAGPRVPVAPYATYGTEELAEHAFKAMHDAGSEATLLANHGLVAAGDDAAAAVETAEAVESVAQLYCQARAIGAEPTELSRDEIRRVAEKFEGYGQDR